MPEGNTPLRAVRVPDEIWEAAKVTAEHANETVSEVVRRALAVYADRGDMKPARVQPAKNTTEDFRQSGAPAPAKTRGVCQVCGNAFELESADSELLCPKCKNASNN